jgi:hypothetical protein
MTKKIIKRATRDTLGIVGLSAVGAIGSQALGTIGGSTANAGQAAIGEVGNFIPIMGTVVGARTSIDMLSTLTKKKKSKKINSLF